MKKFDFLIEGPPKGKGRPRVTKNGTFTPRETLDYERQVVNAWRSVAGDWMAAPGQPVAVRVIAYFDIPKSHPKWKREKEASGYLKPTKKPDADNIAKIIMDGLNGVAYNDDAQVTSLYVGKAFSPIGPFVEVSLSEVVE